LDEKGVFLKSETIMSMTLGLEASSEDLPHELIFDKPFLLCLKEKSAKYPYFAMWIDNTELLLKE